MSIYLFRRVCPTPHRTSQNSKPKNVIYLFVVVRMRNEISGTMPQESVVII